MFQKIKDLTKIKEIADEIIDINKDTSKEIITIKEDIKEQKESVNGLKRSIQEFNSEFKENIENIKKSKEEFQKEIYEFKLLKGQIQSKIIDTFKEELHKELKIYTEKLNSDVDNYNELKNNINLLTKKVLVNASEIDKFNEISKSIKVADFDLTKHRKAIETENKEKLELLKKIDHLETLLARMSRNRK